MGKYVDGKWVPTFEDSVNGVGPGPDRYRENIKDDRITQLQAALKRIVEAEKRMTDLFHKGVDTYSIAYQGARTSLRHEVRAAASLLKRWEEIK